ncbi:MAG: hypothetical protein R6X25_06835 [Candidatus Krumholzibacteriia bacterium]
MTKFFIAWPVRVRAGERIVAGNGASLPATSAAVKAARRPRSGGNGPAAVDAPRRPRADRLEKSFGRVMMPAVTVASATDPTSPLRLRRLRRPMVRRTRPPLVSGRILDNRWLKATD